jgi:hypothetical protein
MLHCTKVVEEIAEHRASIQPVRQPFLDNLIVAQLRNTEQKKSQGIKERLKNLHEYQVWFAPKSFAAFDSIYDKPGVPHSFRNLRR